MCGITGFWDGGRHAPQERERIVERMSDALYHRGPDAGGSWCDADAGVALGHRRLAIVDLSEAGAQPMHGASGRYVLAYNGELYNHRELRAQLVAEGRAPDWRGTSDTETLLAAIEAWGFETALQRIIGMFAVALWDRETRKLSLARDRLGEKPLYFGRAGDALVFGSELKALCAYPGFVREIDDAALGAYLRYAYVPEPLSIYRGIRKLAPGHRVEITGGVAGEPQAYWTLDDEIARSLADPLEGDYGTLCKAVEAGLSDVVSSQTISDVPLGVFLSGGIDSSLITALLANSSPGRVRSFSIGFDDARLNEAEDARRVAEHLGTIHTEFTVTDWDARALIPDLSRIYDEPFADPSQIPTTLLSRLTQEHVTVALSGDGGDEMFGGYNRYIFGPAVWGRFGGLPGVARRGLGRSARALQASPAGHRWNMRPLAARLGLPVTAFEKVAALGGAIERAEDFGGFYTEIASVNPAPESVLAASRRGPAMANVDGFATLDGAEWMMAADATSYLPGDILVKVDRAAMSASLETRAPFLDQRTISLAWRLPSSARFEGRKGKRILRDILYRHVPREIIDRPKQGFSIPTDRWLRGELRDWAGDLLAPDMVRKAGLLDPDGVKALWDQHQAGEDNAGPRLWTVLMAQCWAEDWNASTDVSVDAA